MFAAISYMSVYYASESVAQLSVSSDVHFGYLLIEGATCVCPESTQMPLSSSQTCSLVPQGVSPPLFPLSPSPNSLPPQSDRDRVLWHCSSTLLSPTLWPSASQGSWVKKKIKGYIRPKGWNCLYDSELLGQCFLMPQVLIKKVKLLGFNECG